VDFSFPAFLSGVIVEKLAVQLVFFINEGCQFTNYNLVRPHSSCNCVIIKIRFKIACNRKKRNTDVSKGLD